MSRILTIAAVFAMLAGPAFADNNPNKPGPAPSIEKKEVKAAQGAYDRAVISGNVNRIQRTQAELDAAIERCGNPCN